MLQNQAHKRTNRLVKQTAAALLAVTLLSGCSLLPQKEKTLQPPLIKPATEKVDAVEVKKGTIERLLKGAATVVSSHKVPLFYKQNGRLKDVYVNQGDVVKAGQVVADLDLGDLELRIQLQKLSVERVSIQYYQAKQSGADDKELRLRQIDLEREQIALDSLEQQLTGSNLTSPINGIVSYVDEKNSGDGVNGYVPLVSIDDPTQLYLVYTVDDPKLLSAVQLNMDVEVTISGVKTKGKVLQSPSSAPFTDNKDLSDRNSKLLYIGVTDKNAKLELGKSVDILISLEKHDNVIVLPRSGLRTYLGRTYVQIIDGDRRKEVDVEPGIMTSTEVEINKGLEVGQQIILNNN
ncbi:efflux RND transporter periplasmic adaptor subunit [Paenibacillus solisilvae]|uniref:Efflux RND transporter periplasmic adaptor subunit n=1 Tax=Paenibacillus solisilvae TaxID=2486751 RepID=A0ABW0W509_9BACL